MSQIRTRFAVSPTGFMHLGGVRTAYFSWLLAQHGGQFILRIEDTDKKREVEGAIAAIKESLAWLDITVDEGPDEGGEVGPYVQSERLDIYKKYAQELYNKGLAYADPYTPEELQGFRKEAQAENKPFLFRNYRPEDTPDWDGSQPLRLKITDIKKSEWDDVVRGHLSAGEEVLDDIILIKADGFPTYNFAHIVDDHLMKVTHVLRGEEFIASMPNYLAIYEAFGWDLPVFATLPPVLNKNGGKKLSKRDGAEPVLWYRDNGYLKEAVLNFLASMGWNDGTEKEVWQPDEIANAFSIERVQKSGAKFDDERLDWLNGQHIRALSLDDLYEKVSSYWPDSASNKDDDYKKNVLNLVHERLKILTELPELTGFFFETPEPNIEQMTKKYSTEEAKDHLSKLSSELESSDFSEQDLESKLRAYVETNNQKVGQLFGLVRVAVTGSTVAPGLFETLNALGKEESLKRIESSLNSL